MMPLATTLRPPSWPFSILALALASLTIYLGYFVERTDFQSYILAYGAFFGLYLWAVFFQKNIPFRQLLALGIALRVLLLFNLPNLSDDYFRFIWDGRLTLAGYHPFLYLPGYFIENHQLPRGITPELYHQLNSPHYFTVYPPVCQAVFALAAWLAPENNWAAVLVMKLFLFACELGTLRLLTRHQGHPSALLYALNPLILLEITGNCHFEGAMILFLLTGIVAIQQNQLLRAAIFWALATASKMVPLLFLPIVWRWLGWRKGLKFNILFGLATLVLFAPLLAVLPNILQSLDLYFREFQFNASVYYLVREVGYAKIGWDIGEFSGPRLAVATVAGVLLIALFTGSQEKKPDHRLATAMLLAMTLYLSFAAVVQPWYVCVPLAISLLTRWRYAVLWSGLVALSYSHYDGGLRQEHWGLIALEYGVLWTGVVILWVWRTWRDTDAKDETQIKQIKS